MGLGGKMAVDLSEDTIKKTTACPKDFTCPEDNNKVTCPVEPFLGNGLLFVNPTDESYCSYKTSFGYSHTCRCPPR